MPMCECAMCETKMRQNPPSHTTKESIEPDLKNNGSFMWIITVEQIVEGFLLIAIVSEFSIPAGVNQFPLFVYSYFN